MTFGERIKIFRKGHFSQAELAEEVGVSVDTMRRWEGGTQEPRLGELRNIAKALGVSIGQLTDDNSANLPDNLEANVKTVRVRKKNSSSGNMGKLIVLQQGNTRIEIPATERGYSILEKKLNNVELGEIAVTNSDLAAMS
ncbi:MAG: helix-turn-helix domain-containing protein [Synergistaceae bacterium]|nr:helix-turn-helix domain-containing protein [Synergistaceae bacterium]